MFTRLGGLLSFGIEAALFITADALVRPEPLENEFSSRGGKRGVGFAADAEAFEMIEKSVYAAQGGSLLRGRCILRDF